MAAAPSASPLPAADGESQHTGHSVRAGASPAACAAAPGAPSWRLNKVIGLIETGQPAFGTFLPAGSIPDAVWASRSQYDFVVFEQEHDALDFSRLRDSLQYLLDRRAIADAAVAGRRGPNVVPFVRVPRNGRERDDWLIKQVLDLGAYGIVFPMVETAADVRHILGAMRFPAARDTAADGIAGRVFAPERRTLLGHRG